VIVMDETTDLVKIMWRVSKFFARESCGKCTPCHQGTWWMTRIFERIISGRGRPADVDLLGSIAESLIGGKCFCLLGDSAGLSVKSLVDKFPEEFKSYIPSAQLVTNEK